MTDPAFVSEQRAAWDSVAAGWSAWQRVFEHGAAALNARMLEFAALAPGHRVLDVATGVGEPARSAVQRIVPGGALLALDLSTAMLAGARRRLETPGARVQMCAADAEHLPLQHGTFDAALCRWGLMLMRHPVAVASGIARALRPGGRLVAAVWGEPAQVPFFAVPMAVLREALALPPFDPDAPGPCRLGRPGQLEAVLAAAPLRDVTVEPVTVTLRFAHADDYVAFLGELSSTTRRLLAQQPDEMRARLWATIGTRAAATHGDREGGLTFSNRVYVGRAIAAG